MDPRDHIRIIRNKQHAIPRVADEFANRLFKEVFCGDELGDAIDDLLVDIYRPEDFDDDDGQNAAREDITEAVWNSIIYRLVSRVRELETVVDEPAPIPDNTVPWPHELIHSPTLSDFPPNS